jgi:aminoglycoside phosphotransferase (APT) family kinase protein
MLTAADVVPLLIKRELLSADLIVDDDVQVVPAARRHHNFTVRTSRGPRFFLKQGAGADKERTLRHEAAVYEWFRKLPSFVALEPLLASYNGYDSNERTLVLGLVDEARSLSDHHELARGRLSAALGTAVARGLAAIHRLTSGTPSFPASSARFLQLHRPTLDHYVGASRATLQLIGLIQQSPALSGLLDQLEREWETRCLIHGDLRWDNCLVSNDGVIAVKFVDWEMSGLGDPRWDVGTIFSQCLVAWLLSAPLARDSPPEDFLHLAQYTLPKMRPGIRSFWRSYASAMRLDDDAREQWLVRSVQYAGARLIQTAYERTQLTTELTADAIYLLQLSLNTLQRPLEAAVQLFGIPVWQP